MSKVNLKENIWIEGFNNQGDLGHQIFSFAAYHLNKNIIYSGKTYEITEELAKQCVENPLMGNFIDYKNYKPKTQMYFAVDTAKESIQSACNKEYCLIYKII